MSADPGREAAADILVLSGSTRIRTPAALNHALYAERHGYRCVFDVTPGRLASVYDQKASVILRHLGSAAWIFWIDDDAFVTRPAQRLEGFLDEIGEADLVICASPVNPRGDWTWISGGQFLMRSTPAMQALLEAVLATDLATVRAWWRPAEHGMFTNGDQDALVYQLLRDDSPWARSYVRLPWEAFNSRPYHYERRLDEHFVCHFAVPGGRPKMEMIREFAARLDVTTALVPADELAPYEMFIRHSELAALLETPAPPAEGSTGAQGAPETGAAAGSAAGRGAATGPGAARRRRARDRIPGPVRRVLGRARRRFRGR
jgi:hypothetical protein